MPSEAAPPRVLARTLQQEGLEENLRFLILEVHKQILATRDYLAAPSPGAQDGVVAKDDYIDNLKNIIQRKCFTLAGQSHNENGALVEFLKAVDVVTVNLERIADFCENILAPGAYVDVEILAREDFSAFFDAILEAVAKIQVATLRKDTQIALEICKAEHVTDALYATALRRILGKLKEGRDVESWVTILFIYRYLERMGDSLLNIGEAILSACLGERIKIDQFRALEDTLVRSETGQSIADVTLEPVAETRSGCRIGRVRSKSGADGRLVIFKEGSIRKLTQEKASAEQWDTILPGIAPRIFAFHDHGESGSILFEYLPGHTFEELLLQGDAADVRAALQVLSATMSQVWAKTRENTPIQPHFIGQIASRLRDVYAVHPEFRSQALGIGTLDVPSFDALLVRAQALDDLLAAPFSVFIHGDFNVDNVIYDSQRVHFVDLHRSRRMDWLQDVSVFLVSNFRLQVFDQPVRDVISTVTKDFFEFARSTAEQLGDTTFAARLGLGVARSFVTSSRFVLDPGFAKVMFLRARYLIEQVLAHDPEQLAGFKFPQEVLVD
jgi:phosphate uptake regulator/aminoglycoside phosphotransferase